MGDISFSDLVNPHSSNDQILESDFVRHFLEKRFYHLPQADRGRLEHLLPWQRINEILSLNLLDRNRLRVTRDGRDIPPALYRQEGSKRDHIIASKLTEFVRQNASIVMNRMQDLSSPVRRLCLQIERTLHVTAHVNGYLTFGGGGAFAVHYDPHDVLVAQIHGNKQWFLYDAPEPSPTDEEKKRAKKPDSRNIELEITLEAGDILYVPRGTYHRAANVDVTSVHLTIGLHTPKGMGFVDFLRSAIAADELFRKDVLAIAGTDALDRQERLLKERMCAIINDASLSAYLSLFEEERKPVDLFRLGPIEDFGPETVVGLLARHADPWRGSKGKSFDEPQQRAIAEEIVDVLRNEARDLTLAAIRARMAQPATELVFGATVHELLNRGVIEIVL